MKRILAAAGLMLALIAPTAYALEPAPERIHSPEYRARQEALKGIDALRRFIHRTRMIHQLYIQDFIPAQ